MNLTIHQKRAIERVATITDDGLRSRATMLVLAANKAGLEALYKEHKFSDPMVMWRTLERISAAIYLLSLDRP